MLGCGEGLTKDNSLNGGILGIAFEEHDEESMGVYTFGAECA